MTAAETTQHKGMTAKGRSKSSPFQEACAKPLSILKRSLSLSNSHNSHNSSEEQLKSAGSASPSNRGQPGTPKNSCNLHSSKPPKPCSNTSASNAESNGSLTALGASFPASEPQIDQQGSVTSHQQAVLPWNGSAGQPAYAGAAAAGFNAAQLPPLVAGQAAAVAAGVAGQPSARELGPQRCRRLADVLLRCGKPAEAVNWAEQALAVSPWDVDLLLLRGRCMEAAGNVAGAFSSYMSAISSVPNHIPSLMALASLYKAKGMLDEAAGVLRKALQADRDSSCNSCSSDSSNCISAGQETAAADADVSDAAAKMAACNGHDSTSSSSNSSDKTAAAVEVGNAGDTTGGGVPLSSVQEALAVVLTDLGTRAKNAGRLQECEQLYREALALHPSYPSVHYNLGVLASEGRRWTEALKHYLDTLTLAPHHAQALCNCGVVYRELERLEDAVAAYEAALAVAPNYPIVRTNLAVALTDLGTYLKLKGQLQQGIVMYERALALVPRHSDALYNLGVACAEAGLIERAMFCYELTTHFSPQCAEAWNNLGVLHKEADNLERAAECYMAALNIRPNFPQSLNNLAMVLTSQGKAGEALSLLQAAISAMPDYAEAHNNLGVLQRDVGSIPDALASYERALALVPDSRNAGQNRLLALNYIFPGEDPAVCAAHAAWGEAFQAQQAQHVLLEVMPADRDTKPGRSIKVGYVTPDLFTHSVSYFAEAPLTHHNKQRVQMYVYSCVAKPDGKTARLKQQVAAAGGVWRDVTRLPEPQLAQLIRDDEIDILVELTGHTANNRLGVCAMRAAPIQITWIGYPNSTGLSAVDYRFTDAICDPVNTMQTFAEELVRLPHCFLCYTPAVDAPPVAPLPAAVNGFVTFGSFNNLAKITPQVLGLWAEILQRVPASRLVLKAKPFSCPAARHHIMAQLTAAGVESWRVDLLPLTAGNGDHLSVYGLMDISLDPFPYAGTTTTTESLYMGVPVVTLQGNCHAHNVSCSLLSAVGLADQWVAKTRQQYVELAVSHANNILALQELRQRLRPQMLRSRMCDGKEFVADLEDTYQKLWQRWVVEGGRRKPIPGLQGSQQQQGLQIQPEQGQQHMTVAGGERAVEAFTEQPSSEPMDALVSCSSSQVDNSKQKFSSKIDSSGSHCLAAEKAAVHVAAAPAPAGAFASAVEEDGGGGGVHKGRRLSCSCDAAATVHAGAVIEIPLNI